MPSFATPHDTSSQGSATILMMTLDSSAVSTFVVTNIALAFTNPNANTDNQIDVAHLGQTTGESAARMDRPLIVPATGGGAASGRQVTFDYIGKVLVSDAATGTYKITIGGVTLLGGTTASYHTVSSSTLTLATNDAIRGQAVLTIAR